MSGEVIEGTGTLVMVDGMAFNEVILAHELSALTPLMVKDGSAGAWLQAGHYGT